MDSEKYIVLEIQTMSDGQIGNLVTAYADKNQAESAYHSVLAAAALSNLPKHAASLLSNEGYLLESKSYSH